MWRQQDSEKGARKHAVGDGGVDSDVNGAEQERSTPFISASGKRVCGEAAGIARGKKYQHALMKRKGSLVGL
jgi:lipoate-protein ligase A